MWMGGIHSQRGGPRRRKPASVQLSMLQELHCCAARSVPSELAMPRSLAHSTPRMTGPRGCSRGEHSAELGCRDQKPNWREE